MGPSMIPSPSAYDFQIHYWHATVRNDSEIQRETPITLHLIIPLDTVRPAGHDAITYSRIRVPPRHLASIRCLVETPLSSIPTLRNIRRGPEHRPLIAW
jgi:hypothetical protein